ncbi:MAG TPA: SH3 domain-containing protein, partial [Anaerolineales bacterium]|nr:SH3 domain-containing protein [Anaerolineales bacterium]
MSSNPFQVRVQPSLDPPGLRLRAQATTASDTLAFESPGTVLTVLETEASARPKLGVNGQWLRVRDANSREGYVAAWYVEAATGITTTTSPQTSKSPPTAAPSAQALVDAINAERLKKNVQTLKVHSILMNSAQNHAEYMASGGGITHYSADGSRPFQRHLA